MPDEKPDVKNTETPEPTFPAPEDRKAELRRQSVELYGRYSPFHPDYK